MTTPAAKTGGDAIQQILRRIRPADPERLARLEREEADRLHRLGLALARRQFPFGERFNDARFSTYRTTDPAQRHARDSIEAAAQAAVERTKRKRPWVIMSGPPGGGKSHLLAAAYWYMAGHARREDVYDGYHAGLPRVYFAGELFDTIRGAVYGADRRDKTAPDSIRAAIRARTIGPLVIIDDYGVGLPPITAQSQTQQEITFTLFNELYNSGKPLLLATNLPIERARKGGLRLCDVLGARAWDRCQEAAEIIICNWPSYRGERGLL